MAFERRATDAVEREPRAIEPARRIGELMVMQPD